ncbi:MAG: hypothetical protein IKI57_01485 [Clostridia bacterium]|nr:hypothetical protein [Clostridia bacterium]
MNVLIVEEDLKFAHLLTSEFKKSSKVKSVSIVKSIDDLYLSNYKESNDLKVNENSIIYDLSIINIDLLKDNINDLCLLNSKDYIGYSSNNKNINKYINSSSFLRILKMPISIKEFVSYLNNQYSLFNSSSTNDNECDYLNRLSQLGFNIAHCGTHYLAEGINIAKNIKYHTINELYDELSKRYKTNAESIKWSIYNSVNWAYNADFDKKMDRYFKIYDGRKPTPKFIIDYFSSLSKFHGIV